MVGIHTPYRNAYTVDYTTNAIYAGVYTDAPQKDVTLDTLWAEHFSKIPEARICLSSGIDSRFSLWLARKHGVNLRVVTYAALWQGAVVNAPDVVESQRLCSQLNLPLEVIDLHVDELYNSNELLKISSEYLTSSPQIAVHLKFLDLLGNDLPVIMGGDIPILVVNGGPASYENATITCSLNKSFIMNYVEPYRKFSEAHNISFTKNLFLLNSNALYLGLMHNLSLLKNSGVFANLVYDNYATSRVSAHAYKLHYYKSLGYDLPMPLLSRTGFEDLRKHLAIQTGVYNEFDVQYRDTLNRNVTQLLKGKKLDTQYPTEPILQDAQCIFDEYKELLLSSDKKTNVAEYSFDL